MNYKDVTTSCDTFYPGEYVPLPSIESMLEKQHALFGYEEQHVKVKTKEHTDCFHFDIMLPGINREEIFIEIFGNKLSVVVLHPERNHLGTVLPASDSAINLIERYINLPENADAEFMSAEYKQGVLKLCIPKSELPFKPVTRQIVAY